VRFLYGYAVKHPDEQCAVSPNDPTRTLCGRDVAFLPVHDRDYTPLNLHTKCRDLIFGPSRRPIEDREQAKVEYGICPECWGSAPVFDGLVQAHGEVVIRGGKRVVSEQCCSGEGARPEGER
jgi:hypothetical protein